MSLFSVSGCVNGPQLTCDVYWFIIDFLKRVERQQSATRGGVSWDCWKSQEHDLFWTCRSGDFNISLIQAELLMIMWLIRLLVMAELGQGSEVTSNEGTCQTRRRIPAVHQGGGSTLSYRRPFCVSSRILQPRTAPPFEFFFSLRLQASWQL